MADRVTLAPLAPRDALEYFRSKGYAPALQRFDYRDLWQQEHARSFVVAKAMQDDILTLIRERLDTALADGQTLEQFRTDLAPALKSAGWWGKAIDTDPVTGETREVKRGSMHRLRVIYDTNLRTAHAAGRWTRIQRTKEFFPYLEYVQIDRPTAREAHKPFDGLILPVDHPIWQRIYPPNGWFCGCDVRQTNARKMAREGKTLTTEADLADKVKLTDWLNKRTGETEILPEGLDPAFDSNPGATWLDIADRHTRTRLDLPDSHIAFDRALLQEIRARGLRDGDESLVVYDLDQPVERAGIDMARSAIGEASSVAPTPRMWSAMADPDRRVVAIHDHPSSSSFSDADFRVTMLSPGLHQLVAVGLDGSIFRIGRTARTRVIDPSTFDLVPKAVWAAVYQAALAKRIPDADIRIVASHLQSALLAQLIGFDYDYALSGRSRDALRRNRVEMENILRSLTGAT